MVDKKKIEKILCPTCGVLTNHEIIWESKPKNWEDDGIWEQTNFDLLQCLGCETPTLRKKYLFSEDINIKKVNGEDIWVPEITSWPKVGQRMLKLKYIENAPPKVNRIYKETIGAYNSEMPILCAAGIRAIIESICKDQGISKDNLKEKINFLKEKGIIIDDFAEGLHENRLIGNNALHDFTLFGDTELKTAIELIEILIDIIYETKIKTSLLKTMRELKKR